MADYTIRPATLGDVDALVHQRIAMFREMQTQIDAGVVDAAFREWLMAALPAGTYRAWVVESGSGAGPLEVASVPTIVAGGGMTVIPWPPGPWYVGGRIAFVYNVYTEPPHRRHGLARMVMDAVHACCRAEGIGLAGLNASGQARALYESMGYRPTPAPMMLCGIE